MRKTRDGEADGMTATERRLADIWRQVLNVEMVQRDSNFYDLGGDSLLAMRVLARVRRAFGISLSVRKLLGRPTLAEFATVISSATVGPHRN